LRHWDSCAPIDRDLSIRRVPDAPMVIQPVRTQLMLGANWLFLEDVSPTSGETNACVIMHRSLSIRGRVTYPVITISVSLAACRCRLTGVILMLLCFSMISCGTRVTSHPVSSRQGIILPTNLMPRYTGSNPGLSHMQIFVYFD